MVTSANANGANMVVLDRVFVILVTEDDKMPYEPDWKGEFAVSNPPAQGEQGATIGLLPVQSIMQVPNNAILCANPNEGILLLQKIKAENKPNMSGKSGLQACVVHTEAIFDFQTGTLVPNLMLFPVGFMPYEDMVKEPTPEQIAAAAEKAAGAPSKAPEGNIDTPTTPNEENVKEGAPTEVVDGSPADNPAPATASMKVEAPAEKA